jgi:hypothetical protein
MHATLHRVVACKSVHLLVNRHSYYLGNTFSSRSLSPDRSPASEGEQGRDPLIADSWFMASWLYCGKEVAWRLPLGVIGSQD